MTFDDWYSQEGALMAHGGCSVETVARAAFFVATHEEREACATRLPAVLFDGFAVLQALNDKAKARTSAENVSDVLDAVVRIMRSNAEVNGAGTASG
jgi:hypothetical protein